MNLVIQWLINNWASIAAGLYIADKIAKVTPTKYDDFVVDVVKDVLKRLLPGRQV